MKIQIMSDLHLEMFKHLPDDIGQFGLLDRIPMSEAEVLVLAGDVCYPHQLKKVLDYFCGKYDQVVFVPGNHDYWGQDFETLRDLFHMIDKDHNNLHILDRGIAEIGDVRFVGATLWFRDDPLNFMYESQFVDFQKIKNFRGEVYGENEKDIKFLESGVERGDVVITHHFPSRKSVAERYKGDPVNRFFLCDMEKLIYEKSPKLWIHGHTHDSFDYELVDTRVVCNPYGYPNYGNMQNKGFNPSLVIEV